MDLRYSESIPEVIRLEDVKFKGYPQDPQLQEIIMKYITGELSINSTIKHCQNDGERVNYQSSISNDDAQDQKYLNHVITRNQKPT